MKRLISSTILIPIAAIVSASLLTGTLRAQRNLTALSALPLTVTAPADNQTTPEKIELGRLLFWDPILSGNSDVACSTCHHPDFGYAENIDISIGVDGVGLGRARRFTPATTIPFVQRNSQTILNTAFNGIDAEGHHDPVTAPMFWDLRAKSLEEQALLPILTFEEMRGHGYSEQEILPEVVNRLGAIPEYRELFAAFGGSEPVNAANLGKALAAFQRTLVANNSPFDRYIRGDSTAMTDLQLRGMREFERVGCINCHSGPMFSDYKLHVLGVGDNFKLPESDVGFEGTYAFRTPSLRNLAYTAPYMHSGILSDLDDVLDFYDRGGRRRGRGRGNGGANVNLDRDQLDPLFRRLGDVDDSEREIIAFLGALNDDSFDRTIPASVPSGLNPGGRIE
jgi:cytochrome c peroxidase